MNYGSDVQPFGRWDGEERRAVVGVSTSFYDRLVCVWEVEMDGEGGLASGEDGRR